MNLLIIFRIVVGKIDPSDIGFTLTHEHLNLDFNNFYKAPPNQLKPFFDQKIDLKNVGFIRQYPYSSKYNVNFEDDDTRSAVLDDLKFFKESGGRSIVENTIHGLNRNLKFTYEAAKRFGLNIVAGTGHYIAAVQNSSSLNLTVEQMAEIYTKELVEGVDVTLDSGDSVNVKCGVIGEVASVYPIHGKSY